MHVFYHCSGAGKNNASLTRESDQTQIVDIFRGEKKLHIFFFKCLNEVKTWQKHIEANLHV